MLIVDVDLTRNWCSLIVSGEGVRDICVHYRIKARALQTESLLAFREYIGIRKLMFVSIERRP